MKSSQTSTVYAPGKSSDEDLIYRIDEWLSEIGFLENELRFFCKVMDNYRIKEDQELNEKFEPLKRSIIELETQRNILKASIEIDRKQLSGMHHNKEKSGSDHQAIGKIERLQSEYNALLRKTRQLKEDFFRIADEL